MRPLYLHRDWAVDKVQFDLVRSMTEIKRRNLRESLRIRNEIGRFAASVPDHALVPAGPEPKVSAHSRNDRSRSYRDGYGELIRRDA